MLSPDQLEEAGQMVAAVYRDIEAQMLDRLVRLMLSGEELTMRTTAEAAMLAQTHTGELRKVIADNQGAIDGATRETVERLLEASDSDDISRIGGEPVWPAQVEATVAGIGAIIERDNLQMVEGAKQAFIRASAEAVTSVNTGQMTRNQALHHAVRTLTREGIDTITYQNRETRTVTVRNKVDVAVNRHVRTQIAQVGQRMTSERMEKLGCDLVEVSSHPDARPSHAAWQGRCYSLRGDIEIDGVKYPDFYASCMSGTLGEILGGVNCRHSYGPYRHGAPRAYEPDPRHPSGLPGKEVYELEQKQRYHERQIRAAKRELRGAQLVYNNDKSQENLLALQAAKLKLGNSQESMRTFLDKANARSKTKAEVLRRKPDREWAGDMPKVTARKASGRTLNEFINGEAVKSQLKAKGVGASKASAAIAAQLRARGLQPSDFKTLTASEQQSLWQTVKATLAPSRGTPKPKGKHAEPFKRIAGSHTMAEDRAATNPRYDRKNPAYSRNCQRCVAAYEARRRGYDVEATARGGSGDRLPYMHDPQGWPQVFKDPKLEPCFSNTGANTKGKVESLMASYGDGARAIVRVQWRRTRSGHVFIAEQVNGRTVFHDPQTDTADCSYYFASAKKNQTYCLRIDNREFTDLIFDCAREK